MTTSTANRPLATVLAVAVMASFWMATLAGPVQHTASASNPLAALSATTSSPILM